LRARFRVRREELAFRLGFPAMGAIVAIGFAWLLLHF
jgi:hypothetical protein